MNLRQFDLNLLVTLDVLLAERNVTRAAKRLHLSQPTASAMLSRLRILFDDELLVRVGRGFELTPFAEEIMVPVRECIEEIETLINFRQKFEPETEDRSFSVIASDYVMMLLLPSLLNELARAAPKLSIHFIHLRDRESVVRQIASGDVDFGIIPHDGEACKILSWSDLFYDDWVCAAWADHPSLGKELTKDEFLAVPHLRFTTKGSLADQEIERAGYARDYTVSSESLALGPLLVQGTKMIAVVPKRLGENMARMANLKLLRPPFSLTPLRETLYWSPRYDTSPAHRWLRRLIENVTGGLRSEPRDHAQALESRVEVGRRKGQTTAS